MRTSIYHFYFRKRKMPKPEPKTRKRVLAFVSWIIILQGIIILGLGIFSFTYLMNEGFLQDNTAPAIIATYIYVQVFASILIFGGVISIFVLKDFFRAGRDRVQD